MALEIRLLGQPCAELDGTAVPGPRGRKSWALLAVLVLAERPPSRRSLASLLFPAADDPLGALRWTLSQLRSALAGHVVIEGDPVVVHLEPNTRIDVVDLGGVSPDSAGAGGQARPPTVDPPERLLDGADGVAGPDFDLWLTAARHRLDAACGTQLRRAAEEELAAARPGLAVTAASRAVALGPQDPSARATLVNSLLAAGDHAAALAQLREWSAWVRRESRVSQLMTTSRNGSNGSTRAGWRRIDTDVQSKIEAGQAAMAAGAVTTGVAHLRDAVRVAVRSPDEGVQAAALFALGDGLVHAVAAHGREGMSALREAARLAKRAGDSGLAAEALRNMAFVENSSGRAQQARGFLSAAASAAGEDRCAMSSVRAIEGMYLADRGKHKLALAALRRSAELAESTGRLRQAAWSISIASRSLLQREEFEAAAEYADLCGDIATAERWTAMKPWMEAILADLDLAAGHVDEADRRLRHAWSMSLVLGDWCWQGMTARGLGLVAFARGDVPQAVRWLDEAARRAREDHDRYVWIHGWVQDALCRVTVAARLPRARTDVARLAHIAAASEQPDFAARAALHRSSLGVRSALDDARSIAATIDNPALTRMATRRRRVAV